MWGEENKITEGTRNFGFIYSKEIRQDKNNKICMILKFYYRKYHLKSQMAIWDDILTTKALISWQKKL